MLVNAPTSRPTPPNPKPLSEASRREASLRVLGRRGLLLDRVARPGSAHAISTSSRTRGRILVHGRGCGERLVIAVADVIVGDARSMRAHSPSPKQGGRRLSVDGIGPWEDGRCRGTSLDVACASPADRRSLGYIKILKKRNDFPLRSKSGVEICHGGAI